MSTSRSRRFLRMIINKIVIQLGRIFTNTQVVTGMALRTRFLKVQAKKNI